MGIGYPEDIVEVIKRGVDMFDCVLPTRLARHGVVWEKVFKSKKSTGRNTKNLKDLDFGYCQIDLTKSSFKNDAAPISAKCGCYACKSGFSRAYIRHLVLENEPLGIHLTTLHNLHFVFDLIRETKDRIRAGHL